MKKLFYKIFTTLILITILFSGICWFYAEQILDQFIRPEIEKRSTQLLEAQVQIEHLAWTEGGLKIRGLNFKDPQQFTVIIPEVNLKFTFRNLWHRQLEVLHISRPQIEISLSQDQKESATTLKIPDRLPLTITELTMIDGVLLINSGDRQWQLHDLNYSGTLQQKSAFNLAAFFGPDITHPVAINGTIDLSLQQTLTLETFSWQGQQLISEPLRIVVSGTDFNFNRTRLHLEHFDHSMLQNAMAALGQSSLLPEALSFSINNADIIVALQNQAIGLELQVTEGMIGWNELEGSLSQFKITGEIARDETAWRGDVTLSANGMTVPDLRLNQFNASSKLDLSAGLLNLSEAVIDCSLVSDNGLSAQVNILGTAEITSQKFSLDLQKLSLLHLNYMSADGQAGVGEAKIELRSNIDGSWSKGPIGFDLNGTVTAQEVLAGEFYADLSPYQSNVSIAGDFIAEHERLTVTTAKINIPQIGVLTAAGQVSPQNLRTRGLIEIVDLDSGYGEHLGPLLGELKPTLSDLKLKGELSLDYNLSWNPSRWQTEGALQLKNIDAHWEHQNLEIIAGNGSIPFFLSSGQPLNKVESEFKSTGKISFSTLSAGLVKLQQKHLELVATDNQLAFLTPLQLQLADGQMAINHLTLGWSNKKPQGSAQINITKVNLETLTRDLGLPAMQGHISADLGTLNYVNQQLSTAGVASIQVFDGMIQLRNMHYSAPFSRYPIFHTDIDFSGLNLLQATRVFDFGEINGVVDGHIHGLKLFGTTPAAFEAAVATRDTGKRNISVKALNNLSIISQGGMTAALSRGIYRFIDFYRFQKIGFKCALDNDTFTLLGTALTGSNRYLVHGGLLPPKIDITTTSPTISFKEMINRLSRIDRAGT